MTVRIRPNRLYFIAVGIVSLFGTVYLYAIHPALFSIEDLVQWDLAFARDGGSLLYRNQTVFTNAEAETNLQRTIRITLAQSYENARLSLPPRDEDEGEATRKEEGHEEYIFRLSGFVLDYFEGSKAQEYLIAMLRNLNDHISPPLLKSGLRKGIIKIVGESGKRRRRGLGTSGGDWEVNVFDRKGMDRGLWALSKGSVKMEAMWRNLTLSEDRKIMLKYLSLLLWGGAYAEDDEILRSTKLHEAIHQSSQALADPIAKIRTTLQSLALSPPGLPQFIPPSLDPNWTTRVQTKVEKEIGLVLHRRPGSTWVDHFPLSSDTTMAKAFHPVFLDIVERINGQITQSVIDRKTFVWTPLDDVRLYHSAVDRYLQVQYGITLEDLIYRDEDLRIGGVLLLRQAD